MNSIFENNGNEHSEVEKDVKSKASLIALVSIATLAMISAGTIHNVLADPAHCFGQECYDLGYQHGLANPGAPCPGGHSDNFCAGWNVGASSSSGGSISGGRGSVNTGTNWMDLCNRVSFALISSCDTLVNPDNTLTDAGHHAYGCIQNGALLAGAALLLGTPPTAIVSALPIAAQLFGCGDVVDFSKLTLGQLKGLGSIFR